MKGEKLLNREVVLVHGNSSTVWHTLISRGRVPNIDFIQPHISIFQSQRLTYHVFPFVNEASKPKKQRAGTSQNSSPSQNKRPTINEFLTPSSMRLTAKQQKKNKYTHTVQLPPSYLNTTAV